VPFTSLHAGKYRTEDKLKTVFTVTKCLLWQNLLKICITPLFVVCRLQFTFAKNHWILSTHSNATSKNVSWPLLVLTLSTRYWTVFAEFGLGPALLCSLCIGIFVLVSSFLIFILWVTCVRLSWLHRQLFRPRWTPFAIKK